MKGLLSYSNLVNLNLVFVCILGLSTLFFRGDITSKLVLLITFLISFAALIFSKGKAYKFANILSEKVVVLTLFILAVFLGFAHYIFAFSQESGLVAISYIFSFFILITLIFTNFKSII